MKAESLLGAEPLSFLRHETSPSVHVQRHTSLGLCYPCDQAPAVYTLTCRETFLFQTILRQRSQSLHGPAKSLGKPAGSPMQYVV